MTSLTWRRRAYLVAPLAAAAIGLGAPALGLAASGGGGLAGNSASSGSSATPGNGQVSASAGGTTITTSASGFLNHQIVFSGNTSPRYAGRTIEIDRLGHETNWSWSSTVQGRIRSDGSFSVAWQANHIGQFSIRAVVTPGHGGAAAASAWPSVTMIVYRPAVATWYGPGSWGSTTACGDVLHRTTLGVANRTLPCGTRVALYYHGKSMVVPVIDRGPYTSADWDLTQAAARQLGMESAGRATIGSASLPARN